MAIILQPKLLNLAFRYHILVRHNMKIENNIIDKIARYLRSYDNFRTHYYSNIEKWARLEEVYTIVKVYSSVKLLLAAAENFPLLHIWVHCENDNSSWIQSFFFYFLTQFFFQNGILKRSLLLRNHPSWENFTPCTYKETQFSKINSRIQEVRIWKLWCGSLILLI